MSKMVDKLKSLKNYDEFKMYLMEEKRWVNVISTLYEQLDDNTYIEVDDFNVYYKLWELCRMTTSDEDFTLIERYNVKPTFDKVIIVNFIMRNYGILNISMLNTYDSETINYLASLIINNDDVLSFITLFNIIRIMMFFELPNYINEIRELMEQHISDDSNINLNKMTRANLYTSFEILHQGYPMKKFNKLFDYFEKHGSNTMMYILDTIKSGFDITDYLYGSITTSRINIYCRLNNQINDLRKQGFNYEINFSKLRYINLTTIEYLIVLMKRNLDYKFKNIQPILTLMSKPRSVWKNSKLIYTLLSMASIYNFDLDELITRIINSENMTEYNQTELIEKLAYELECENTIFIKAQNGFFNPNSNLALILEGIMNESNDSVDNYYNRNTTRYMITKSGLEKRNLRLCDFLSDIPLNLAVNINENFQLECALTEVDVNELLNTLELYGLNKVSDKINHELKSDKDYTITLSNDFSELTAPYSNGRINNFSKVRGFLLLTLPNTYVINIHNNENEKITSLGLIALEKETILMFNDDDFETMNAGLTVECIHKVINKKFDVDSVYSFRERKQTNATGIYNSQFLIFHHDANKTSTSKLKTELLVKDYIVKLNDKFDKYKDCVRKSVNLHSRYMEMDNMKLLDKNEKVIDLREEGVENDTNIE